MPPRPPAEHLLSLWLPCFRFLRYYMGHVSWPFSVIGQITCNQETMLHGIELSLSMRPLQAVVS